MLTTLASIFFVIVVAVFLVGDWKPIAVIATLIAAAGLVTAFPILIYIVPILVVIVMVVLYISTGPQRAEKRIEDAQNKIKAEQYWIEAAQRKQERENERQRNRDAEQQSTPYTYSIGQHANEALAIRYGIANQEKSKPLSIIKLRKTKKLRESEYEVLLTDYRDRVARAIIEVGTEYVKTFLPLQDDWFQKHAQLEVVLKGNGSFSLKELARFHVDKTISPQ